MQETEASPTSLMSSPWKRLNWSTLPLSCRMGIVSVGTRRLALALDTTSASRVSRSPGVICNWLLMVSIIIRVMLSPCSSLGAISLSKPERAKDWRIYFV